MQANKAQLSATVSSQTENIRTGLELVAKSKQTLLNLQRSFRVRCAAHFHTGLLYGSESTQRLVFHALTGSTAAGRMYGFTKWNFQHRRAAL